MTFETDAARMKEIHREGRGGGDKLPPRTWGRYTDWEESRKEHLENAIRSIISESQNSSEMPGASTTPEGERNPEIRRYQGSSILGVHISKSIAI